MQSGWEEKYYLNQAGSGFSPFAGLRFQKGNGFSPYSGLRYQKGNGFLGRVWKGVTLPLLKYIGRHGLEAAGNIIKDVSANPDDVRSIVKKEARRLAGKAIEDGGKRLSTYVQTGKGVRTRVPPPKTAKSNKKDATYNNRKKVKTAGNNKRRGVSVSKNPKVRPRAKPKSTKTKTAKCRVVKKRKISRKSFLSLD